VTDGRARWSLRLFGGLEVAARPGGEKLTALGQGLLDFGRAKGWPDLRSPVGADDFVCD
jgi:hypothetical protein